LPLPVGLLHRIRSLFATWCLGCLLSQHLLLANDRPSQETAVNLIKTSEAFSSEQQQFLLNGFGWIPETAQGGMLVRRWFLVYRVRVNLPA
jgi:hypothetical protein